MRGSLGAGDPLRLASFRDLAFELFEFVSQPADVALLPKYFLVEVLDGVVLKRQKGFKLYDSLFHASNSSGLSAVGEWF